MHHRILRSQIAFALMLLLWGTITYAEPYHPYPVIFVHGINGGAWHWGVNLTAEELNKLKNGEGGGDFPYIEPWRVVDHHMMAKLWNLMLPYTQVNLNYLAAISLDDPSGSIDPGPYKSSAEIKYYFARIVDGDTVPDSVSITLRNQGAGFELQHFIKQVLFTYYDTTWNLNPNAKVVLVAHSMGGVIVEEALHQEIKQMEGGSA